MSEKLKPKSVLKVKSPEDLLIKEIQKLNKHVKFLTDLKFRFLSGIVEGFGAVIGATVIVSLVLLILNQLEKIGFLSPFVQGILDLAGK